MIETKSRDAVFLEDVFPSRGEVSRDVDLYEMEDIQDSTPGGLLETEGEIPQPPRDSGAMYRLIC